MPLQLVHAEDVAQALVAGVLGRGAPGIYNLAAPGEITLSDIAREMGWSSVRLPKIGIDLTARVLEKVPYTPAATDWIQALRVPVLMDTARAREELGLVPGVRRTRDPARDDRRRPGGAGGSKARSRSRCSAHSLGK